MPGETTIRRADKPLNQGVTRRRRRRGSWLHRGDASTRTRGYMDGCGGRSRPGTPHNTPATMTPPPPHTHTNRPHQRRSRQVLAVSHAVHSHPSIHARSLTHARPPPSRSHRPLVSGHTATPARLESHAFRHQTPPSSPVRGFATPSTHFLHQIWPGSVENLRGRPPET